VFIAAVLISRGSAKGIDGVKTVTSSLAPSLTAFGLILASALAGAASSEEHRVVNAMIHELGGEAITCPDYSAAYPATRINADARWSCLIVPTDRDETILSAALLVALNRVYSGRLAKIFSSLERNPDCDCQRFATYHRRQGRLIAWSFSFMSTQPYGPEMIVWLKHEALS
jgi:hypothetical protein